MESGNSLSISTDLNKTVSYSNTSNSVPIFFVGYLNNEFTITKSTDSSASNNLLQPIDPQSLKCALELAFQQQTDQTEQLPTKKASLQLNDNLLIKKRNAFVKVVVDDILYIESEDKYCYVQTVDSRFLVQKSLRNFSEILPDSFVALHRKYVVNTNQIHAIFPTDYTLTLKNNAVLPVSQRHRKLLLSLFTIIK
ncbi:MAG: LytTR family DNA-binding domain-containing protein [Bacteroidota bacterium]